MTKLVGGSICFALVTVMTTEREITHAITAPTTLRENMIQLEGDLVALAICTPMLPFGQDIFADLHPEKGSALIGNPVDFWIVQRLWIKANQFLTDRPDGTPAPEPLHPGHHLKHAAEQRGSQPALRSPSIRISGRAIPSGALSSGTACGTALAQRFTDLRASMRQFRCPDHVPRVIVDHRQARGLGAGINFETQWRNDCL